MGSVNATIISQLREQIQSIEHRLMSPENKGNTTTGSSGHQNPPTISSSQKETLDMIARKVSSIEHKIATVPPPLPGNRPGLQHNKPKTEGQGAGKKGTAGINYWYKKDLQEFSTERLVVWAAAVSTGGWGRPINDQPERFNHKRAHDRVAVQAFLQRALDYYYGPDKLNRFLYAPPKETKLASGWTKSFDWSIIDHNGDVISCSQRSPIYTPGRHMKLEGQEQH